MKYANGRDVKKGDPVVALPKGDGATVIAGTVNQLLPKAAQVTVAVRGGAETHEVETADCIHAEDAWNAVKAAK